MEIKGSKAYIVREEIKKKGRISVKDLVKLVGKSASKYVYKLRKRGYPIKNCKIGGEKGYKWVNGE